MKARVAYVLLLLACATPATAQIQPGPNIAPNGMRFTYSPRFNYLGPPAAFVYGQPTQSRAMPMIVVPRETPPPPPPPMAYAPAPLPPPLVPEPPPPCMVTFDPWQPPLLNVRASPNGWIVGQLPNGTPVIPTGEIAGNWMVIAAPVPGWVFRPYIACLPPPIDAYAYAPPDTSPLGAPPMRNSGPPGTPVPPGVRGEPAPRAPGQRQRSTNFPCPDGCPRGPDDQP